MCMSCLVPSESSTVLQQPSRNMPHIAAAVAVVRPPVGVRWLPLRAWLGCFVHCAEVLILLCYHAV